MTRHGQIFQTVRFEATSDKLASALRARCYVYPTLYTMMHRHIHRYTHSVVTYTYDYYMCVYIYIYVCIYIYIYIYMSTLARGCSLGLSSRLVLDNELGEPGPGA